MDSFTQPVKENHGPIIREYGPEQAALTSGLPEPLRAFLRESPQYFVDNAHIVMRVLEVDGQVIPIVLADPARLNADVVSPHAHYIRYTCEEMIRRHPRIPAWLMKGFFALWDLPIGQKWLDRVVYVNNWLIATNPAVRLSAAQVDAVTRYLRAHYPGRAIVFRTINAERDRAQAEVMRKSGYRLVAARTVYLLDPLPDNPADWKDNTQRDVALLQNSGLGVVRMCALEPGDAARLEALYRDLYVGRYSRLNPQFNRRFFELVLRGKCFEGIFLKDDREILGMVLYLQDGNTLISPAIGYDLGRSQKDGLYRQVIATLILEARSRKVVLNLSAGVGRFKLHRGARRTLEYDAVRTSGLPFRQRLAWRLVEAQGRVWSRKLSRKCGSGGDESSEIDR